MRNKYILFLIVFVTLFLLISYSRKTDKTPEAIKTQPVEQPVQEATITDALHTYHNDMYDVTYAFPSNWFGPEIYDYENGFRLEIGTDKVYPYGTDLTERMYTKDNNYYIVVDFNKKPTEISEEEYRNSDDVFKQYELVSKLKDGKNIENSRSLITKIRDITKEGVYGIEYISTLSESAQTELTYVREVLLIDSNLNTIRITGIPSSVVVEDKNNWKKYYEDIDAQNQKIFEDFVDAVSFPGQKPENITYINTN